MPSDRIGFKPTPPRPDMDAVGIFLLLLWACAVLGPIYWALRNHALVSLGLVLGLLFGYIVQMIWLYSGNLYLKGKYGFNIFTGDANYSSGLQSVIYGGKTMYGFGGELYFSPNTFVELMAITNMGEVIVLGGTFDIKYTYFNVGLGYSF